jgi:hypothetical protein
MGRAKLAIAFGVLTFVAGCSEEIGVLGVRADTGEIAQQAMAGDDDYEDGATDDGDGGDTSGDNNNCSCAALEGNGPAQVLVAVWGSLPQVVFKTPEVNCRSGIVHVANDPGDPNGYWGGDPKFLEIWTHGAFICLPSGASAPYQWNWYLKDASGYERSEGTYVESTVTAATNFQYRRRNAIIEVARETQTRHMDRAGWDPGGEPIYVLTKTWTRNEGERPVDGTPIQTYKHREETTRETYGGVLGREWSCSYDRYDAGASPTNLTSDHAIFKADELGDWYGRWERVRFDSFLRGIGVTRDLDPSSVFDHADEFMHVSGLDLANDPGVKNAAAGGCWNH